MSGRAAATAGGKNARGGYGLGVVLFAIFATLKLTVGLTALIVVVVKAVFGR